MKKIVLMAFCLICGLPFAAAQPINVIFETDYGNDADDAIALDAICKYADMGKLKLLGVSTHKAGKYVCPAVDASLTWYGYKKVPVAKSITPVERPKDGNHYADSVALKRDAKGKIAFKQSKNGKYPNAIQFYRKTLSRQPDNSVVIISVGFGTNLAQLLESKPDKYSDLSGRELVAKKVKLLSTMMGCYRDKPFAEFNVNCDIPAMAKVMREWPTEIVENPFEIGERVVYPSTLFNEKLNWGKPNPLLTALNGLNPKPHNQCAFDVASVIYLVRPELFNLSSRGTISVDPMGLNHFTPSASGKHRYLTTTKEQDKALLEEIVKITSMKPKNYKD